MALLPCSQAAQAATASMSLLPGIDALFCATICCSVLMPASETSCAFIVLSSKKTPPLARNCCSKAYWLPGLPAFLKCTEP